MYDNSGGVALGGGAGAFGVLAFTGFSVTFFAVLAFVLLLVGLLLWRRATVALDDAARSPRAGRGAGRGADGDPRA